MEETGAGMQDRTVSRSWMRSVGILAFYAVLGPLTGVVSFAVWFVLLSLLGPVLRAEALGDLNWVEGVATALQVALLIMVTGMPIGYSIGLLASASVGLVVALWEWRFGVISWVIAFGTTLVIWLVPYLSSGDLYVSDSIRLSRTNALLPAYLGAAAICTWAASRLFRITPANSGSLGGGDDGG